MIAPTVLVVVCHYNARPTDDLIALLDGMRAIPSGYPFAVRVVVNRAEDKPLELPTRHSVVEVCDRPNQGFNLGAWEYGWRRPPARDFYLFLQEECRIIRRGWLGAFVRAASRPGVGLVGESLVWRGQSWEHAGRISPVVGYHGATGPDGVEKFTEILKRVIESRGIPIGRTTAHLQSLILAARREVLESIGGIPTADSYSDSVGCEVALTKLVERQGLKARQVGLLPFRHISHPQWAHLTSGHRRAFSYLFRPYLHAIEPYVPGWMSPGTG